MTRCGPMVFSLSLAAFLFVTSIAQSPNAGQAQEHLKRAQAALKTNQLEVAKSELQDVLKFDPNSIEAHTNLGVLLFFQGNCQTASLHFEQALKLEPSLAKPEALLGICDKRLGKSTAAERLKDSFSKLNDPGLRTQVGMELAGLYYQQGDLSSSANVLRTLVELNPENVDILYMAQRTYAELADDTLNKLAILAPQSARMEQVIAERLVNAGDLSGAITHYKKALDLNPRLPGVHYELAETLLQSTPSEPGVQSEAEREIGLAIQSDGPSPKTECLLGQIAIQRSNVTEAFDHYSKANVLNPFDTEAQLGMARVLMTMQKPNEARKYLEMVVKSDPLNGEAHYRLATVLRNLQLNSDAEKEMRVYRAIKQTRDQLKELYRQMNKPLKSQEPLIEEPSKSTEQRQP